MTVAEITNDNIEKYMDHIDPDEAENIERSFFRGIVLESDEGNIEAGAIWEVRPLENVKNDVITEISWLHMEEKEAGEKLIAEYTSIIQDDQITESRLEIVDENEKSIDHVLTSNGFKTKERECRMITFTVADLKKTTVLKLDKKVPDYVHSLSGISEWEFNRGLVGCIFQCQRPLVQDLCTLPTEWYEPDVSCYVETDGRADGFLLVHKTTSGKLRIELFINNGPDPAKELFHMARFAAKKAIELYDDDTEIVVIRRDVSSAKLAAHLFPTVKGQTALVGNRREKK